MDWQTELFRRAAKLNLEVQMTSEDVTLFCPKRLPVEVRVQLKEIVPIGIELKFAEGPKQSTMSMLGGILSQYGVAGSTLNPEYRSTRHLKITSSGPGWYGHGYEHVDWSILNRMLAKDGFFDSWEVVLNGEVILRECPAVKAEMERNDELRDTCIQKSDITDLRIALETAGSFEEFLRRM